MNIFLILMALVALSGAARRVRKSHPKVRPVFGPSQVKTFKMPESCKGKEFCFDNHDYPIDIVEDILKDVKGLVVAKEDHAVELIGKSYTQRLSENLPFNEDCRATSKNNTIYYIVDQNGKDRVVVQLKHRFEQYFSIKWCEKEDRIEGRTHHFLENNVKDHEMYCKTKYMNYDFLVLSEEPGFDGKWKMEKARTKKGIPVCCMCRYDKTH